jgi:hypothetical protein
MSSLRNVCSPVACGGILQVRAEYQQPWRSISGLVQHFLVSGGGSVSMSRTMYVCESATLCVCVCHNVCVSSLSFPFLVYAVLLCT